MMKSARAQLDFEVMSAKQGSELALAQLVKDSVVSQPAQMHSWAS